MPLISVKFSRSYAPFKLQTLTNIFIVYDFVLMYSRSKLSVVTLRQFLKELCLFFNLEYRKYVDFGTFLLNALTYSGEILHMTLLLCTTDQVRLLSLCVNF